MSTPPAPASRTLAWRTIQRCTALAVVLALAVGVLALIVLVLSDTSRSGAPTRPVVVVLGLTQTVAVVAAVLSGVVVVRVARGGDPLPLVNPLVSRLRAVGSCGLGVVLAAGVLCLVLEPDHRIVTLALCAVGVQPAIALRALTPRL